MMVVWKRGGQAMITSQAPSCLCNAIAVVDLHHRRAPGTRFHLITGNCLFKCQVPNQGYSLRHTTQATPCPMSVLSLCT